MQNRRRRRDLSLEAADSVAWHALPPIEVATRLATTFAGLDEAEAAARLARDGPNVFEVPRRIAISAVLLAQLKNVVVALLGTAVVVAALSGDALDAIAIGTVLWLNVGLGFVLELRAHRALEALRALDVPHARVLRRGAQRDIAAHELVLGDVVQVEAGQVVPADVRLIEAAEFQTTEAMLTGESDAVRKDASASVPADTPLADRLSMAYKTTTAVTGRALGIVVATGMQTEVGRVGTLVGQIADAPTPLELRINQLGRQLALVALGVAALVAGLAALRGEPFDAVIQTAIALAVAAVPEGLPVVGTIAMALGVRRMARQHVLVRRLAVVEALGSATVICTDKTGTLTAGEMTATVIRTNEDEFAVSGAGFSPEGDFHKDGVPVDPHDFPALLLALRIGLLANRSQVAERAGHWHAVGDPTEAALVAVAGKAGLDQPTCRAEWPEVSELPFSSERMLMATFHRTGAGGTVAHVKGAPQQVLEHCAAVLTSHGPRPLTAEDRERLHQLNLVLAAQGLRVLALATGPESEGAPFGINHLTWVGLVGLSDPPAPGVARTIQDFQAAGIRTVMLTGDQRRTAEAMVRHLGLAPAGATDVFEAREINRLDDAGLREAVTRAVAFTRVSPEDKLRLVTAFQQRGEVVAMLGDGVNDAAALRKADIGVVMGSRGTDLARESADLVLLDDRFPSIALAIAEGRVVFDNIRKFVFYLFSCNLAEVFVLLAAGFAGAVAPLTPLQILWLNLLTDTFPALALAVEPGEPDIMQTPPREPGAAILSWPAGRRVIGYAALISGCALAAFFWALQREHGSNGQAVTMAFMTLAFAQILHLGNARSQAHVASLRRAIANRSAVLAVVAAVGLQLLAVTWAPLASMLRLEPLDPRAWMVVVALGAVPGVFGQALKWRRARPTHEPEGSHG